MLTQTGLIVLRSRMTVIRVDANKGLRAKRRSSGVDGEDGVDNNA